jgi:hypothetical protein
MTPIPSRAIAGLLLAIPLLVSCSRSTDEGENSPPAVGAITWGTKYAVTDQNLDLSVTSSDGDPGQAENHTYKWTASQGSFVVDDDADAIWDPGSNTGTATVTVEVSDNLDVTRRSTTITVARQLDPPSNLFATDTTLTQAGGPYVSGVNDFITVSPGATLTIEPGTEILFPATESGLTVSGLLEAHGTAAEPIHFGSNKKTPKPGDWKGIVSENAPGRVSLKHCFIEYPKIGVQGSPGGLVQLDSCNVSLCQQNGVEIAAPGSPHWIRSTCIDQSTGHGISLNFDDLATPTVRIERCRIQFNGKSGVFIRGRSADMSIIGNYIFRNEDPGIRLQRGAPLLRENSFEFNDDAGSDLALDCTTDFDDTLSVVLDADSNFWGGTAVDSTSAANFIRDNADNPTIDIRAWILPLLTSWAAFRSLVPNC